MEDNPMIGTRELVEASILGIKLDPEESQKLVDVLTERIDEEVAEIVRENLEERSSRAKRKGGQDRPEPPVAPEHRSKSKSSPRKSSD